MLLYLKQKVFSFTDKYNIYNANQELVYEVKSEFFTFGAKFYVCDIEKNVLFFIKQKIFQWMPTYEIYQQEECRATIKKQFTFFKPRLNVSTLQGDYEIQGDAWNMNYQIYHQGILCASVAKKWLAWSDTYEIDVQKPEKASFICALIVAVDHCLHNESANTNTAAHSA